jgi:hypothetical protein
MSTSATDKPFKFNGEKSQWPQLERAFTSFCTTKGIKKHAIVEKVNRVTFQVNPPLPDNEVRDAVIAKWNHTNQSNNLWLQNEVVGKTGLMDLCGPRIQEELGAADDLGDMWDLAKEKYKPKRDANNNWSIEQVKSIRKHACKPMPKEARLRDWMDDIERQIKIIDMDKTTHAYEFDEILKISLLTPFKKGEQSRFVPRYEMVEKLHLSGEECWKFLLFITSFYLL